MTDSGFSRRLLIFSILGVADLAELAIAVALVVLRPTFSGVATVRTQLANKTVQQGHDRNHRSPPLSSASLFKPPATRHRRLDSLHYELGYGQNPTLDFE
jgi:hypothetical protein